MKVANDFFPDRSAQTALGEEVQHCLRLGVAVLADLAVWPSFLQQNVSSVTYSLDIQPSMEFALCRGF